MRHSHDYFPVLDIRVFNEHQAPDSPLLFHELQGARAIEEPHKHDFFIIILFEQGSGTHTIDFVAYPVAPYQVHLVLPGQVHAWQFDAVTVGYQLMIGREWFESILPSFRFPVRYYLGHPVLDIPSPVFTQLLYEFRAIAALLRERPVFRELIQGRSRLIGLLVSQAAEAHFADFEKNHAHPVVARLLALIEQYFRQERSVSFYAGILHISANYLNIICRKNLKTSASALIQDRILLEAKRLLKVSEMSVKEIVYELGFYDHASFAKFFKAQTGMTPSQFKEKD